MTRCNCGISVTNLTDEHLLSEHRELKRLTKAYFKAIRLLIAGKP